ncbi:MAG: SDR family oxidoreductase [Candidatus Lokiarchaeota archaeon]|nr:SDR family oxidoreductase [Candidatus Lokiarchaeota archaeon]
MRGVVYLSQTILITGIGGGIGRAIFKSFLSSEYQVITSSRTEKTELDVDFNSLSEITHYQYDLTKEENVIQLFEQIKNKYNKLDVFINTIGGSLYSHKLEDFPLDEFREVLEVNLVSAFLLTKYAIQLMKNNKDNGGNIIHLVSSSAKKFSTNKAPYGIAKAGLARLIQYAAKESAIYDIRINGLSPTYVFTERHKSSIEKKVKEKDQSEEEILDHILESQLLKKPMLPEDLIPVIILLSKTKVITGQIYNCTLGEIINY